MEIQLNKYQSSIESLNLNKYPLEIQEQFMDFINNVPFIKYLISPDRPYFKDLPRDSEGKAIIDITKPPILTDMDYFRPAALHFQQTGKFTNMRPNPNPNSEYGKWVREEVRRCYKGYVRESDGAWVTGDQYWFLNYWPIMQTRFKEGSKKGDRVVDFPEVWDGIFYRYNYIDQAINGGLYNINGGNNGCEISSRGKAHPYSQEIYTPKGKLLWKDISIGDYIYGDDGNLTKVIDIPFDDYCDVYEITLKDGRKVKASGNHLWRVYRRYSHCFKIMSTYEMMQDFVKKRKLSDRNKGVEYIYAIPANKGVEWNYKQVSIDPYTFGLCLGDGCFRTEKLQNNIYYTSLEEDMCTYLRYVPYDIVKLKTESGYFIRIPNAKHILMGWGLHMKKSEDKFIPNEYKYNSREVRLNILKGLMDSDGFVDSNGVPIIGVSSKQLADDIAFISRSLGYNCLQSVKKSGYKINGVYKKCLDNYIVRIYTSDVLFNLERKQKLVSKFESTYSKSNRDFSTIVDIRKIGYEKCKCISVDNESQCYLIGDFITTHNSKSYTMSAMMGKRFVLGESELVNKRVKCMATAYQKQFLTSDGIMNKFQAGIDFLAQNTQFPSRRLKSSLQEMTWKMGYRDLDTGTDRGTLNEVIGVSAKDDISKVRGKRQNLIVVEEFGAFRNVLELYNIMIPSVQEGDISFGSMYLVGTSGDSQSDFAGAQEIVYNPKGYRMYGIPNVYDKEGQGRREITFFFPGYLNRKGCYDKDGNSDVTKALLEILEDRYRVKYNSTDLNSITRTIAEIPVTPQEALLRTKGNIFPITQLNERLNEIDNNPNFYDDVWCGELVLNKGGNVEFRPSNDMPIRNYPLNDNTEKGCLEIYVMPEKNRDGKVFNDRYCLGYDPYDNDQGDSQSLGSVHVLDLFTDKLVAEYTGRTTYAEEFYEIVRLLCLFYNGKVMYESNLKGCFAYFSKMNCTHLLADTPEYLRDKQIIKYTSFGNNAKGIRATAAINNYADALIKEWLIKPIVTIVKEEGEEKEVTVPNLFFIRNRALLKELVAYNPFINVDRVRALGMLMLYRQEKIILYQGDMAKTIDEDRYTNSAENDEFFLDNFDRRFNSESNILD